MMFGVEITTLAYAVTGVVLLVGVGMLVYLFFANKKDLVSSYTIEDAQDKVEVKTKNLYEEPTRKTFSFEESVVGASSPTPSPAPAIAPRPTIELPPVKLKPILKAPASAPSPASAQNSSGLPVPTSLPLTRKQMREQSTRLPLPRKDS